MTDACIQLAHGGGGRLSRTLIEQCIVPRFGDGPLRGLPDAAALAAEGHALIFSTDSFVVSPLEFPGGNIGHLAVHGSVNDVAVAGGRPRWLSLALILEEGLAMSVLERVLDTVRAAADEAGVTVVTGDTKVVERGKADGLYINTAVLGEALPGFNLSPCNIQPGDMVLASGTLGDHGMAVMAARNGLSPEGGPVSDTASVIPWVEALLPWAETVRFMRDPTRGGVAAVLNEIVEQRHDVGILLDEPGMPFSSPVRATADMLGMDPLQAACEGRVLAVCAPHIAETILACWRALPSGDTAAVIGTVSDDRTLAGLVAAHTLTGGRRIVDVPRGELLPRIC